VRFAGRDRSALRCRPDNRSPKFLLMGSPPGSPRGTFGLVSPFAHPSRIVVSPVTRISENFDFLRSLDLINISLTIVCKMVAVQKERIVI
jgi:hypothetical protein